MSTDTIKLWRHLFGGQSGILAIWSAQRTGDKEIDKESAKTCYFDYPAKAEAAFSHALEQSESGREAYFCVHLLTARRRTKENAASALALWGESDGAEVPTNALAPTALVESSPGRFHVYYRLTAAIAPEFAEDLNKRLALKIGADPSGFDLTQLLRVPGTVNHKYPDEPVVKILELDGGRSYSPRELDNALPEIGVKREPQGRADSEEPPVVLDERALRVWRGEEPKFKGNGTVDRSASLVKIGRALYDAGGNRSVIEVALEERDRTLGWNKYTGRWDAAERYAEIVDELEENGRNLRLAHPPEADATIHLSSNGHGAEGEAPDGAKLLERIAEFIRRYVALGEDKALLCALWIVHTHALDAADTTPYLNVKSAEKRSGKTRLLEVLSLLAAGSWLTGRVTAAVLVRKVAAEAPALLLDESDAAFKGDREYAETLRGVLNAGFRRGGVASLCVGQGANITYEDFPVYCPKVIAGIGKLPDTVADRSIPIELRRRRPSEKVERFRFRKVGPEALPIQHDVRLWAQAHLDSLSAAEPDLPDELDDRAQDIMEPLLAIADEVGGEWPECSRRAAVGLLTGEEREDAESLGVRLLRDIRGVFDDESSDRLPTGKLLEALHVMEEAPWGSLRGEALDARGLARLLKPYGVKPEKLREGDDTFRGYRRTSFEDAWTRYLPSLPGEAEHVEHPEHSADRAGSDVPHKQNVPEHSGYLEHQEAHKKGDVPRVPDVPHDPATAERPLSDALEPRQSATVAMLAVRKEAEAAGVEMRRSKSGPALALKAYLEKSNDQRLEWLTKAVLTAQGKDTAGWEAHASAVKEAAEDPANHPLDCECEACL